jgi:uncharacterized membrane protein SirB2
MFDFARRLGSSPFSVSIQSQTWLIALLQTVHILMIALVFVSMLMFALRVMGRLRTDESLDEVWARFAPWMWGALAVMVVTGSLLFIGEPMRQVSALSFWLKMGLIVLAVIGVLTLRRAPSKGLAWTVITMWTLVIFLGRAIAYDVEVWQSWHLGT